VVRAKKATQEVEVDRRASKDRRGNERRAKDASVPVERRKLERRVKVSRRRQIDPTTCERDYTGDEVEFMAALDAYKRRSGRMFPTCSEILEVIRGLGYEKRASLSPRQEESLLPQ
jgi:hypothetical protein